MNKLIVIILSICFSFNAWSAQVSIQDRILSQNYYLKIYPSLFGNADFGIDGDFKKLMSKLNRKQRKKAMSAISKLDKHISPKLLKPLIYWKYIKPNALHLSNVISYIMLYKLMILRDYIDHPFSENKKVAINLLKSLSGIESINSQNMFKLYSSSIFDNAAIIASQEDHTSFIESLLSTKLVTLELKQSLPSITAYSLSKYGLIAGNKVEIISENDSSKERIDWLNQRVIFAGGKLDFDAPYIKMPTKESPEGHIVFQEDPIFQKIRDMIAGAKDSIFIDIFLFGGTMGATLSEYLLDQTAIKIKQNPNFKVLMLHDYATNYNMVDEMMPIFAYIKNRIENDKSIKGHVSLLQANIFRHPPGIPFGISELLPKTDAVLAAMQKQNTYYESKIDHSKVIVVDANTDYPKAYFGSKNWTDHSGGYYFDDAIYVEGPAAALVQASYYDDIDAALTTDPKEQRLFFYRSKTHSLTKNQKKIYNSQVYKGYDNIKYLTHRDSILNWIKIKKDSYPQIGTDIVRLAEANVDGKIRNVRNILVDMIIGAKENIYMEQLFIYDPYIIDTLIKSKLERPELKIRILADHNGNFGMNGLPNTLFIKELQKYGIEVRARKTIGVTAIFPDGTEKEYHQENHRKITSVDGKVLLGGSSNLNPDTLQGSFREFGAQIFAPTQIQVFEKNFMIAWNDSEETMDLNIDDFQAKVGETVFSKKLSALINDFGAYIFRSKDKLERRY